MTLRDQILEELSYTDMTEDGLKRRLKHPVHRELTSMQHEGLVRPLIKDGETRWTLIEKTDDL